ncbi:DMT family transporter [Caldibacillus debilis]|uniref:DMT family transporter n=1 Tax=Caldibacillus debilis TaxID=301148 RepID=UPI000B554617|nr:DMT family transporter [Caldibacillus debilis]MBO2481174.1 EamA family transporter [Bacillaceae bacterium]MBY6272181.1 EamA family transporter [Bacillaceae bacterium]OUM89232.1 MAG: transporter [Caldibacillus debilis]REJ29116.1 MAG: EamA family transporter [Caldibacillus debilis]
MKEKLLFSLVMLIFGSIGLFVKHIALPSDAVALFRGASGSLFLFLAALVMKNRLRFKTTKRNWILLLLSGSALGLNWIFLFEAYRYTTVSAATLAYYFAPVLVMALSPFVLKEKWTAKSAACIAVAMAGLFFILGQGEESGAGGYSRLAGIGFGLLAALFFAGVVLLNKCIKDFPGYETALIQLFFAALVLFPYVAAAEEIHLSRLDGRSVFFLLVVGIVHTGLAYFLYFSAIKKLPTQTVAVLSYFDPVSAVAMSALVLKEMLTWGQVVGGIFILGAAFFGEFFAAKNAAKSMEKKTGPEAGQG